MPFLRTVVNEKWFNWPALPDLFSVRFHGVLTNRDAFLVDVHLDRLRGRVGDYFDSDLSHEEIERRYPSAMRSTARSGCHLKFAIAQLVHTGMSLCSAP